MSYLLRDMRYGEEGDRTGADYSRWGWGREGCIGMFSLCPEGRREEGGEGLFNLRGAA